MTYQTPTALNTGQPLPSAQWNVMRSNLELLSAAPACTITRNTAETIAPGDQLGTFTAAPTDARGFWNPDTPTRATVPTGCGGVYLIAGWHNHRHGGITLPGGGAVAPSDPASAPKVITTEGTAGVQVTGPSIEPSFSFSFLYPLAEGDSVALWFGVTPIVQFSLSLQWLRP